MKAKTNMQILIPIFAFLIFLFDPTLSAQQIESSILRAEINSGNFHLAVDGNGQSTVFNYTNRGDFGSLSFYGFDEFSAPIFSKVLRKQGTIFKSLGQANQNFKDGLVVIGTHSTPVTIDDGARNFDLLIYDVVNDSHIALDQRSLGHPSEVFINNNNILLLRNHEEFINIYALDRNGNALWSKRFEFFENGNLLDQYSFITFSKFSTVQYSEEGFYFIIFTLTDDRSLLLKISEQGVPLESKIIEQCSLLDLQIDEVSQTLYFSGLTKRNDFGDDGFEKGIIIKSDFDLNIEQANVIYAEQYPFLDLNINLVDGNILMSSNSFGKVPLVYATFNSDLEIIDQYGYNIRTTRFRRGHHFSDSGIRYIITNDALNPVVYKTNFKGELNDCNILESCLVENELQMEEKESTVATTDIEALRISNLQLEDVDPVFSPTECMDGEAVSARFDFPDTLCIGSCERTLNSTGTLAETQKFELTGPNVDMTFEDRESISFCFEEPGTYNITQTIFFLGCEEVFSQDIVILDTNIDINLDDEFICESPPYAVTLTSDRNLEDAVWSTGETGLQIEIMESGFYLVTVTDGFCEDVVGASFEFLEDIIGTQDVIELPNDTTICIQKLPYELSLENRFNVEFQLNGETIENDIFELKRQGRFTISTEIETCQFQEEYTLMVDSCLSQIYLPTAFSPNADGINDFFEPLGTFFEVVDLSIYDRWGVKLHEGDSPWDGKFRGEFVQSDIYYFTLSYRNTLAEVDEMTTGVFTVVR